MSDQNDTNLKLIEEHKVALLISGNLSSFQLENLKTWPYLVFDKKDLASVKINYNFINTVDASNMIPGSIEFDFKFRKGSKVQDQLKVQAFKDLTVWTKFLFWNDTEVKFKKSGKRWK